MAKKTARRSQTGKSSSPRAQARNQKTPSSVALPSVPIMRTAGMAFGALAVLRLIASQFPDERLWGLSYPGFLPLWTELAITALGIAFATP
ncbi:MAG: hypothetical protein JXA28_11945, partial [Bacteroidetes bacterium]|nr:hypothetical protein [Bacteroidota bacterium]